MLDNEVIVRVGGAAGDGVASTGENTARAFTRSGYNVHAYSSYQSVIRGGHVWYNIRAAKDAVPTMGDAIDVLVCLDQRTADVHAGTVRPGGAVVHDPADVKLDNIVVQDNVLDVALPLKDLGKKHGTSPLMKNTVAFGAVTHLLGWDLKLTEDVVAGTFGKKGKDDSILNANMEAFRAGYATAKADTRALRPYPVVGPAKKLVLGNNAIALGALAGGLGFYAAYPMTPASGVLHFLARHGPKNGVVVKQCEDEIAVVNMTIGAAFAGARAMCGTSGGGFALMSEAIGLAAMIETGIVVVESQRGGPSTGLPTKYEQGDLWQMLGASQGDYPRAIIAPTGIVDAYQSTAEALNIAEKYQMPVILASDFYLSEHMETVDALPPVVTIQRGAYAKPGTAGFKRYAVTATGVSPRSVPGMKGLAYVAGSDEHDESGQLVSDIYAGLPEAVAVRTKMMKKRMGKVEALRKELPAPAPEGPDRADVTIVGWGATKQVIEEALSLAPDVKAARLQFKYIVPFHAAEATRLLKERPFIVIEGNYSGQFERYVRSETGLLPAGRIRRYDGELFTPSELAGQIQEVGASL